MDRGERPRGTPPEGPVESRGRGEPGTAGRYRRADRYHIQTRSEGPCMTRKPRVVVMIRIRLEIVVMSVGRSSQQIRELGLVLERVRIPMLRLEMDAEPEHRKTWREPRQEDGGQTKALEGNEQARSVPEAERRGQANAHPRGSRVVNC